MTQNSPRAAHCRRRRRRAPPAAAALTGPRPSAAASPPTASTPMRCIESSDTTQVTIGEKEGFTTASVSSTNVPPPTASPCVAQQRCTAVGEDYMQDWHTGTVSGRRSSTWSAVVRFRSKASALTQSLRMNTTPGDERLCSAPAAFLADVVLPQVRRCPRLAAIGRDVHPDDAVAAAGARTYKGRVTSMEPRGRRRQRHGSLTGKAAFKTIQLPECDGRPLQQPADRMIDISTRDK